MRRRPPSGGSSGCSCGESVAVDLRPLLSRDSASSLLKGPLRTSADVRGRDHDGLAVWPSCMGPQPCCPTAPGEPSVARSHVWIVKKCDDDSGERLAATSTVAQTSTVRPPARRTYDD
jgi:hypothetical protein